MKKLILHIGTHKTGTSAIQVWLEQNRERLRTHGYWYGSTDRPPKPEIPAHTSLFWSLIEDNLDFGAERAAILADFEASDCDTLILSNEGLSQATFRKFEVLREFAETFEITVICFLRRQDYFLEAWWNQRCKQGEERRTIGEFVRAADSVRRTNYVDLLSFWSSFATVKALDYSQTHGPGAVCSFAKLAGLPFDGTNKRLHVSPSMNCAAFCNRLNRAGIPFSQSAMEFLFRGDRRRSALGSALRAEVLARNEEQNEVLAHKFGVAFDSERPEEPEEAVSSPSVSELIQILLRGFAKGRRSRDRHQTRQSH
jgi:hypothetical protein